MHPDLETLLAVRDGEADPEAVRHVASCPTCSAELLRLRQMRDALGDLPTVPPDRDLWPPTAGRIRDRRNMGARWLIAAAATAILAAGTAALLLRGHGAGAPTSPPQFAQTDPVPPVGEDPAVGPDFPPTMDPEVARLVRNSQRLESMLDRMDDRPTVVSGRQAMAEMGLQERLAQLDARLGSPAPGPSTREEQVGLWKQRVELLGTLAQVKGAKKRTVEI